MVSSTGNHLKKKQNIFKQITKINIMGWGWGISETVLTNLKPFLASIYYITPRSSRT